MPRRRPIRYQVTLLFEPVTELDLIDRHAVQLVIIGGAAVEHVVALATKIHDDTDAAVAPYT